MHISVSLGTFALVAANASAQSQPSVLFPDAPPPPSVDNQTSSYWLPFNGSYNYEGSVLISTELRNSSFDVQPYVANGYIGARVPNLGNGFALDVNQTNSSGLVPRYGAPTNPPRSAGAYLGGFYGLHQTYVLNNGTMINDSLSGPEQCLATIPQWTTLVLVDVSTGQRLDNTTSLSQLSNWSQSQSLRTGIVQTNYTWTPASSNKDLTYNVSFTVFAHRTEPGLGVVRLDVTPGSSNNAGDLQVIDILDASTAEGTTYINSGTGSPGSRQIWAAVSPQGRENNVTAYVYNTLAFGQPDLFDNKLSSNSTTNGSSIQQQYQATVQPDQTVSMVKYVGVVSTDSFPDGLTSAQTFSTAAAAYGWDGVTASHIAGWQFLWDQGDISVTGDLRLDIAVKSSLYNLLTNVFPPKPNSNFSFSFPETGLSSNARGGLVFEGADASVAPALLPQFPYLSSSSLRYRYARLAQANENARQFNVSGALFPQISSLQGNVTNATATYSNLVGSQSVLGDGLSADIAVANEAWNYFLATNDTTFLQAVGFPLLSQIGQFYSSALSSNHTLVGNAYSVYGVARVLDIANQAAVQIGQPANSTWEGILSSLPLPANEALDLVTPKNTGDQSVPGLIYPLLQQNLTESRARNSLDYYSYYQSPDTNSAALYANTAIAKAWLQRNGCSAYTYLLRASQPFLRRPFYYMASQVYDNSSLTNGVQSVVPYLSAHGALLQIFLNGFTGYVPHQEYMAFDPSLPPQMNPGYIVTGLKYHGASFNVNITLNSTTITRTDNGTGSGTPKVINVNIGSRNAKAGNYTLEPYGTLVVPTYRADLSNTTFPGDVSQCKPVLSSDPWRPGQFPLAITDGDNATAWQPLAASNKSAVQIDLGTVQSFSQAYFLWGQSPPLRVSLGIVVSPEPVHPPSHQTSGATRPTAGPILNSTLAPATDFTWFTSSLPAMPIATSIPPVLDTTYNVPSTTASGYASTTSAPTNVTSTPINATSIPANTTGSLLVPRNTLVVETSPSQVVTTSPSQIPATAVATPAAPTSVAAVALKKRDQRYQPATGAQVHWILLDQPVSISEPYDASKNASLLTFPIVANASHYALNTTYNAQYVVVAIEGNSNSSSPYGGTLAELVLS